MTQKKCPVCNYEISDQSKFCPECGAPLSDKKTSDTPKTKTKSNPLRDTLIIVGVLVIIAAGYFILKERNEPPQKPVQQTGDMGGHPNVEGMGDAMGALSNLPTDYNSLIALGNQTMDQGNFALAAECYKRALNIKEDSPDVRTDYGACLHGMGLPARAKQEFHKVIEKYPDHAIANFNLGIVFYSEKNEDSARYYWNQYLIHDPNGPASENARRLLKELDG